MTALGAITVLGWVASNELGVMQPHEHLAARPPAPYDSDDDFILDDEYAMVAEVDEFLAAGGKTLVEATPRDYGRDLPALARIARRTGANIIACTGRHKDIYSGAGVATLTVDDLVEEFSSDVVVGVEGIRCGAIKVATSLDGATDGERKVLLAAAATSRALGVPITTHLESGRAGLEQARTLVDAGAPVERVVIGHIDMHLDRTDLDQILELGVSIQFDQIGHPTRHTDVERANLLARLLHDGLADRICLASDLGKRSYLRNTGGTPGLRHVQESFLPLLTERGVTSEQIEQITVRTPARVFAFASQ